MKKLCSLFVATYFLQYVIPFPVNLFGNLYEIAGKHYYTLSDGFTVWFGKSILKITTLSRVESTGSGDTTLNYVGTLVNLILSAIFSFSIWCLFRKKINSGKIFTAIGIYARIYLAYCCISYGFAKVLVQQFPGLSYFRLAEPYGDSTPMGLFWTFMSGSKPYTIFCGWLEVLAGYLLLFKRTKTIGGLLTIIIMVQIVMVNLCYDVPVKLFSIHLLLMSFLILGDDLKKLFHFLVLRKQVSLSDVLFPKKMKWFYVGLMAQILMAAGFTYLSVHDEVGNRKAGCQEQFFGVYHVDSFNLSFVPFSKLNKVTWDQLIVDQRYNGEMVARLNTADGKRYRYMVSIDTGNREMKFEDRDSTDMDIAVKYRNNADTFYLEGTWKNQRVNAVFTRKDKTSYKLTNTGFHWIQEEPNNQ